MGMKPKQKKVYRTMQGKIVDLDKLIKINELTPAVGNAKVNARGDELGAGGKIIRRREEVVRDYYDGNTPVADEIPTKSVDGLSANEQKTMEEFDDIPVPPKPQAQTTPKPKITTTQKPKPQPEKEPEWIEDEDGNFIRKGE